MSAGALPARATGSRTGSRASTVKALTIPRTDSLAARSPADAAHATAPRRCSGSTASRRSSTIVASSVFSTASIRLVRDSRSARTVVRAWPTPTNSSPAARGLRRRQRRTATSPCGTITRSGHVKPSPADERRWLSGVVAARSWAGRASYNRRHQLNAAQRVQGDHDGPAHTPRGEVMGERYALPVHPDLQPCPRHAQLCRSYLSIHRQPINLKLQARGPVHRSPSGSSAGSISYPLYVPCSRLTRRPSNQLPSRSTQT